MSGTTQGGHQTGQGKAADPAVRAEIRHSSVAFETTGSQELRWVSQHTNHWEGRGEGQAKSNDVPKIEASPGVLSPTPNLWAQQKELKKRAKKVSATEQHYHKLFSAAWSPLGVDALSSHTQHSPVHVGQSFITPTPQAPNACRLQPFHCFTAQPKQSVAGEVRYTLCPHIPSCHGASPTGRVLPSPQLLVPCSQAGSIGGWAEMACRGEFKMGRPHQSQGRTAFLSTFYETKPP